MKTKILALTTVLAALAFLVTGCGPFFRNQAQYDKGEWWGIAGSHEVVQMKEKKMAMDKQAALPALMGYINEKGETVTVTVNSGKVASAGFVGKVANLSSYRRLKFVVNGPEEKTWYLGPGQIVPDYLTEGVYVARIFYGSTEVQEPMTFKVSLLKKNFMGEKLHWFFGSEY